MSNPFYLDDLARSLFNAYRSSRIIAGDDVVPWEQLDHRKQAGWIAAAADAKRLADGGYLRHHETGEVSPAFARRMLRA